MGRLKKEKKGLTLLELVITTILLSVVLMTAATLLINFKKFYFDFSQRQSEIGEISLGILEEIVDKIKVSNKIYIASNTDIHIYVDNTDPTTTTDDTIHRYYLAGSSDNKIRYRYKLNGDPWTPSVVIGQHIGFLNFESQPTASPEHNRIKINIGVIPSTGPQQDFETTVIARACTAH